VEVCPACGQKLAATGFRQATGTFSRRRLAAQQVEGAPYKAQDLIGSRYLIKEAIGVGPLGYVFRAHDNEIDVEVALKVINPKLVQTPDERKHFARHLRLARRLSHPNLVRVYEEGEDSDRPFFTSQFLDGLTLRKIIDLRLQKGQFFSLHEIEPILAQMCSALDGAHKVGPHTDFKPENVLVLPDLLKVTDFGLGLAMPRLPFVQAMRARKAERYLAPEFVDGGEVDQRADLYALGVVLGEMLSGLTPDGSIPELGRRNADVPPPVEGLYRKAVNANPNARFNSAADLIADYAELVRRHAPLPVSRSRLEATSTGAPMTRPRAASGMLRLEPRREKPPPPVSEAVPPPPPARAEGAEEVVPESTQRVDAAKLQSTLGGAASAEPGTRGPEQRESTDVLDSGKFVASLPDDLHTRPVVEPPRPPRAETSALGRPSSMWFAVVALVVVGVGLGAVGGYFLIQKKEKVEIEAQQRRLQELQRQADERARLEAAERSGLEAQRAAREAESIERAVAERLAAEAASAEQAGAQQVDAGPLARTDSEAERSAASRTAALRTAADRAAADEKVAVAKAVAERAAAVRAVASEKAAKERLARERAGAAADTAPAAPERAAEGACPEGMAFVAAGPFKMGTARDDPMMGFDEKPLATVSVEGFCIDVYEHPNKKGVVPMVSVAFPEAQRLCASQGKRLCSEAEWEKSCRGRSALRWPYGGTFEATACNTEDESGEARALAPAGRFAKCRSIFGVADLSGNAAEWTAERIIKGGTFAGGDYAVRCSARKNGAVSLKSPQVGFRCCVGSR
jgi:serine/threonine protein kinase/formylglycine-generating enzyme required for sulfatase activity